MLITKKEVEYIESEYWTCHNKDHRHRKQHVAEKCIAKSEQPKRDIKRWTRQELLSFLEYKRYGSNMTVLAKALGMSRANMSRLIDKAERIDRYEKENKAIYIMPHDRGSKRYF